MIKDFDSELYEKEFDEIKLSRTDKNIIKANMNLAAEGILPKSKKKNISLNTKWIQAAAAVLLVAIIGGLIYIVPSLSGNNTQNSFAIVADAAENSSASTDIMEIYCGMSGAGFMSDSGYRNKQGKKDFYSDFSITDFRIKGNNIKSINIKSNKKSCYFGLDYETDLTDFTDYGSLENSQYTQKELEDYAHIGQIFCDGFTYNVEQTDGEQLIQLGGLFSYVIESDRTDAEIDGYFNEYEELEAPKYEIRKKQHEKYGDDVAIPMTDEEIEIDNKQSLCIDKFREKTLDGAVIDITVNYTDGSSAKTEVNVGYAVENESGEIIFESGTDYYKLSQSEQNDCYPQIVFRYKNDN